MSKSKNALGKGLSALLSESGNVLDIQKPNEQKAGGNVDNNNLKSSDLKVISVPVSNLISGRFQPRKYFDNEKIDELASSIKENGVLQPILIRHLKDSKYEIIAGERRWKAAVKAGFNEINAVVLNIDDRAALEIGLIENIQRQSLSLIEEAEGYRKLIDEYGYTQEKLGESVGKSRSHITNIMRLLMLPDEVKDMINSGLLTMGHARALIGAQNPLELAREVVKKGLSVRETEKFAAGHGMLGGGAKTEAPTNNKAKSPKNYTASEENNVAKDDDLIALENALSRSLGLKVTIEDSDECGRVTLYFNNLSELDKILSKIGVE
jgi:ParB family chromosome partitioning protein